jgi:hypothetical protein
MKEIDKMITNYRGMLWVLIQESKKGTNFDPAKQEEKLYNLLNEKYSKDDIEMLLQEFATIMNEYIGSRDFEQLHKSNGGIVYGGYDTFYLDFASWLVGQGVILYQDYMEHGSKAVLEYIKHNNITREQFEYECMMNAFFNYEAEIEE